MDQPTAGEALKRLEPLVGEWTLEAKPPDGPPWPGEARATIEWHDSGAHLVARSTVEMPGAPDSISIMGCDAANGTYFQLYSDDRGVCRVYEMSIGEGRWELWREGEPFAQRFTATISDEGNTISGRWEKAPEGRRWETDFDLTYRKVRGGNGMDEASPSAGVEATVSLREVTAETVRDICNLSVAPGQERFVAPNSVSIAEAYFCEKAWFRAIYADETPVGFLMLYDDPQKPEYHLWRFMIAESHQGKGYARRAMELLIEHVSRRPKAEELVLSFVPGEGSPEGFYRGLGFEPTGEVDEGEVVMRLRLSDHPVSTAE